MQPTIYPTNNTYSIFINNLLISFVKLTDNLPTSTTPTTYWTYQMNIRLCLINATLKNIDVHATLTVSVKQWSIWMTDQNTLKVVILSKFAFQFCFWLFLFWIVVGSDCLVSVCSVRSQTVKLIQIGVSLI